MWQYCKFSCFDAKPRFFKTVQAVSYKIIVKLSQVIYEKQILKYLLLKHKI